MITLSGSLNSAHPIVESVSEYELRGPDRSKYGSCNPSSCREWLSFSLDWVSSRGGKGVSLYSCSACRYGRRDFAPKVDGTSGEQRHSSKFQKTFSKFK